MVFAGVTIAVVVSIVLGLLVVRRGHQPLIGWLLICHGLSFELLLGDAQVPPDGTAGLVAAQLGQGAWVFLFLWLVLIAYLVPDGRPLSRRWQIWMCVGVLGAVLFVVGAAGDRAGFREQHAGADPPLAWLPETLSGLLGVLGLVLVVLFFFGSAEAVRRRLRASSDAARQQLLWLVWGALAVPVGLLLLWTNHFLLGNRDSVSIVILTAMSIVLPTAIAIAILRHGLFDIQLVLSRTLTYVVLVIGVGALYGVLVTVAYRVGTAGPVGGLVAVTIVAISSYPAHSWLRRRVERWVYGYRSEPHEAIRLLADRAEHADPDALLRAVATAVADALQVQRVSLDLDPRSARTRPMTTAAAQTVRLPLVHRGEILGELEVEVPPGRRLSSADTALLRDLARYVAVLVRSEQQNLQLRESRSRIVAGREEERRRLRRDLHDGVGPLLAAVVLTLNAAQSTPDPARRHALITEARNEVKDAIAEVRRVVDDLRPPAIDEVGLLGAIRQRAAVLGTEVKVDVIGPDPMPILPASVEVAAFRIAAEAMTNVVRHARATHCRVDVVVNGQLELTVADNGCGTDFTTNGGRGGTGWLSMRERAAELGGTCTVSQGPDGGVVVRALVPVAPAPADIADEPMPRGASQTTARTPG